MKKVYAGHNNTAGYRNIVVGRGSVGSASDSNTQVVIGTGLTGKGTSTAFIGGSSGAYQENNSSSWSTTSDRRIKKNIVNNDTGLEKISQIQVKNFEYRTEDEVVDFDNPKAVCVDKQGIQIGAIAQEIEEILPEVVNTASTGAKSVDPSNLTWYLINAIKELNAKIAELEVKINEWS